MAPDVQIQTSPPLAEAADVQFSPSSSPSTQVHSPIPLLPSVHIQSPLQVQRAVSEPQPNLFSGQMVYQNAPLPPLAAEQFRQLSIRAGILINALAQEEEDDDWD